MGGGGGWKRGFSYMAYSVAVKGDQFLNSNQQLFLQVAGEWPSLFRLTEFVIEFSFYFNIAKLLLLLTLISSQAIWSKRKLSPCSSHHGSVWSVPPWTLCRRSCARLYCAYAKLWRRSTTSRPTWSCRSRPSCSWRPPSQQAWNPWGKWNIDFVTMWYLQKITNTYFIHRKEDLMDT